MAGSPERVHCFSIGLIIFAQVVCSASSLQTAKDAGANFAEHAINHAEGSDAAGQFLSAGDQEFSAERAARQVEDVVQSHRSPRFDVIEYTTSLKATEIFEDENFMSNSGKIIEQDSDSVTVEVPTGVEIKSCEHGDAPSVIVLNRELRVEVKKIPEITDRVRFCSGHSRSKRFKTKSKTDKQAKQWRKEFSSDPQIEDHEISIEYSTVLHKHTVTVTWSHIHNSPTCDNYQTQEKVIRPESFEEVADYWSNESEYLSLLQDSNSTFLSRDCIEKAPIKVIDGKEVARDCWLERFTFLRSNKGIVCPYLSHSQCDLIEKECMNSNDIGCCLWKLRFKCYSGMHSKTLTKGQMFGQEDDVSYENNSSFSEVITKLALFEEIQNELREEQMVDARTVQIFRGERLSCTRNVAGEAMYDCCFSHSGLAKSLKLMQCSEEELALAARREREQCHYIGSYPEQFLDLWKSRDRHVFCCFSSKLARVFQEQAREQLGIPWDGPKHAYCKGLTVEQIDRVDFSRLDLSEAYPNTLDTSAFNNKLRSLESRMQEKMSDNS